jgi:hypothetical protein
VRQNSKRTQTEKEFFSLITERKVNIFLIMGGDNDDNLKESTIIGEKIK